MSLSERYGIESSTPGTLTPLLLESVPPEITLQNISVAVIFSALSSITPSFMSILVPTETSAGSPLNVMEALSAVHGTSSVVRIKESPSYTSTGLLSTNFPRRISGPLVSSIVATGIPNSLRRRVTCSKRFLWIS